MLKLPFCMKTCLKPFFTGQGACRGDQRPYLQPVKQNILFYRLRIRALISAGDFDPVKSEFESLYSDLRAGRIRVLLDML
jgi:hypothetical protein